MRVLTAVSVLAFALVSQAAYAQGRAVAGSAAPNGAAAKVYSSEESAAMATANRKKAEAVERARDGRLRKATRGICIGC
jgi:hypothetical protein